MPYDLGNVDISKFLDTILEGEKIRNRKKLFSYELFNGTIDNLDKIDNIIKRNLKDWEYESVGKWRRRLLELQYMRW